MTLKHYGLVRFSRRTGSIDTTMTAIGHAMLQLWALQNTTSTKVTIIIDLDDGTTEAEYHGTKDGFPEIYKNANEFEYDLPSELLDMLREEMNAR